MKKGKINRILDIYTNLMNGHLIKKSHEVQKYGVNERSIQRDLDDIRNYLSDQAAAQDGCENSVVYDYANKGYRIAAGFEKQLTNSEILAVCKILLDSRAFCKKDMETIINKLMYCCVPKENKNSVKELILNEMHCYVEPRHKTRFMEMMWEIGESIRKKQYIEIDYIRSKDKEIVKRKLKPVAIMFSEYYFYLAAYIDDKDKVREKFQVYNDKYPTIYRIDRIKRLKKLKEDFIVPYKDKFQEGEFRKRVQFMYGGKLQKVEFKYSGYDVDVILDRLPTAEILHEEDGIYTLRAEVFGKGIEMWLKSQGDFVHDIKFHV